uniref:NAD(P)-binding protein n=1 Tax=Neorhizobium sp. EC2-8 TaxID=3129230 RepID=UPI003100F9DE
MNETHFSTLEPADMEYDAIVLGAGVSGLVSASVLAKQGCQQILMVDEYEHIGGTTWTGRRMDIHSTSEA